MTLKRKRDDVKRFQKARIAQKKKELQKRILAFEMNCELEPALGSQYSRKKSAVDKNYYRIGHARLGFS